VHPKMNLRLAYSKSIIRPDLREISFFRSTTSSWEAAIGARHRSFPPKFIIMISGMNGILLRVKCFRSHFSIKKCFTPWRYLLFPTGCSN
jgi:hypothetical protein